jgi:3-deoxy-7-phosphoheptulonate synthase
MRLTELDPLIGAEALPSPAALQDMHPLDPGAQEVIAQSREDITAIMEGHDPRMLAVVGPCSMDGNTIGNKYAAHVFAERLQQLRTDPHIARNVAVVMRSPVAKPRTDVGWRGMEQTSVVTAHEIATGIVNREIPLASEIMNPSQLGRLTGRLSLAWIGARDNQVTGLRHLLSAYPNIPVFVKNDGTGDLRSAKGALKTIEAPHDNVEVLLPDGRMGVVPRSSGNVHTGLLWRGGEDYNSPGAYEKGILVAAEDAHPYGADMSHGGATAHDPENKKSAEGQTACFQHLITMMLEGTLAKPPKMVMIEAYLQSGADTSGATPGMSLTDPCVDIDTLEGMLHQLSEVQARVQY